MPCDITYMWNLKYDKLVNKAKKKKRKKQIHGFKEQTSDYQCRERWGQGNIRVGGI